MYQRRPFLTLLHCLFDAHIPTVDVKAALVHFDEVCTQPNMDPINLGRLYLKIAAGPLAHDLLCHKRAKLEARPPVLTLPPGDHGTRHPLHCNVRPCHMQDKIALPLELSCWILDWPGPTYTIRLCSMWRAHMGKDSFKRAQGCVNIVLRQEVLGHR